jgi:hypothetical protein
MGTTWMFYIEEPTSSAAVQMPGTSTGSGSVQQIGFAAAACGAAGARRKY